MTKTLDAIFGRETQEKVCDALQDSLYDLTALARLIKQAHWNVVGPSFRSVHLHLDEIYAIVDNQIDSVAERISAIGVSPSGQPAEVAEHTVLQQLPLGFLRDKQVVELMTNRLSTVSRSMRARCEVIEDLDVVTADMFHSILQKLEMHLWMLRSTGE
jgi:starvation-inducible DNA-binding protein